MEICNVRISLLHLEHALGVRAVACSLCKPLFTKDAGRRYRCGDTGVKKAGVKEDARGCVNHFCRKPAGLLYGMIVHTCEKERKCLI